LSYDLMVYTKSARVPTVERVLAALPATVAPTSPLPDLLLAPGGFVPMSVDGASTGFELATYPITSTDVEAYKADLAASHMEDDGFLGMMTECDVTISFSCRHDPKVEAARKVAAVIARLSQGYLYDPQLGTLVELDGVAA